MKYNVYVEMAIEIEAEDEMRAQEIAFEIPYSDLRWQTSSVEVLEQKNEQSPED